MIWIDILTLLAAVANIYTALSWCKNKWGWHSALGWGLVAVYEIYDIVQQL